MVEQFSVAVPEEEGERRVWRRIRRAAAERRMKRADL
jgi:hypothetical protein